MFSGWLLQQFSAKTLWYDLWPVSRHRPVEPPLAAVNTREWEIISDVSAVSDDPISHSSANNRITVIHIINHRLLKAECD